MGMKIRIIILALQILLLVNPIIVIGDGREIYVDSSYKGYSDGTPEKPYTSIQYAINVANDGDTIYVFSGRYDETLVVDKRVKIWGSIDGKPSIVDTRFDKRYTIEVTADYAEIQGLVVSDTGNHKTSPIGALIAVKANNVIIQGNTLNNTKSFGIYLDSSSSGNIISGNLINNTGRGIYSDSSDTNDILENDIRNCSEYAIYIYSSSNNRVYGNKIENSSHGVYTIGCNNLNISNNTITTTRYYGIYIEDGNQGVIRFNNMTNNDGTGIYLGGRSFAVTHNILDGNERGLTLAGLSNVVMNNTFSNSSASGVNALPNSKGNLLIYNIFKDNGKNAQEDGVNNWSKDMKGNYWDDYGYVDRDLDGIGDKPYNKNGVVDNYPLGFFLKPPLKPMDPKPEDTETGVGLRITLQVKVEDPDSDYLTVYFYRADTEELMGVDKNVPSGGIAEYSFKQPFDTTFAWYVVVNDSMLENRSDTWFFTTLVTPPDNEPPVADAGGPYTAAPGETILFDASKSYDPDGEIRFYRWNFGDGTSEILAMKPQHTYDTPGVYTVTLTVIDDKGTTDTDIIDVVVEGEANKKPIAYIEAPINGVTGETIVLSGINSTDLDGTIVNYTWYLGENVTLYGPVVTYTYNTPGSYLVTLTVIDDDGEVSDTQIVISIEEAKESITGLEILLLLVSIALWFKRKKN